MGWLKPFEFRIKVYYEVSISRNFRCSELAPWSIWDWELPSSLANSSKEKKHFESFKGLLSDRVSVAAGALSDF